MKSIRLFSLAVLLGAAVCRAEEPATIAGTVTDKEGKPLAAATVILVLPPHDVQAALLSSEFREPPTLIQFVADEQGAFRHGIPLKAPEFRVALTAKKPGYLSARGVRLNYPHASPFPEIEPSANAAYDRLNQSVRLVAGTTTNVTFRLVTGRLFRGVLRDEAGEPLAGIAVRSESGERSRSDSQGRFEATGFAHPQNRLHFFGGALLPNQEFSFPYDYRPDGPPLSITLRTGRTLSGIVLNSDGRPEPGAVVEARSPDHGPSAVTDAQGAFSIAGLPDGPVNLVARSLARRERTASTLDLQSDGNEVRLQLSKALPWDVSPLTVFGTQLVKLTPAVNDLYQISMEGGKLRGLVVVDPGPNRWSLDRGTFRLRSGDLIHALPGLDRNHMIAVKSLAEIIAATDRFKPLEEDPDQTIQVPLSIYHLAGRRWGNGTVYWKLTPAEVVELQKIAGETR